MRERIEDLGRITVLLDNLLDDSVFSVFPCRTKDAPEWFMELDQDKKYDFIHTVAYGLQNVQEKLSEIYLIASGQDRLNEN